MTIQVLTGDAIGRGFARDRQGATVLYQMIQPQKTVSNLAVMGRESARWRATARRFSGLAASGQIAFEVASRARFADEVMASAAENVRLGLPTVIVAQSNDGHILAAMIYIVTAPLQDPWRQQVIPREGAIHLLAVDPENLTGSPGQKQLRGLGTAMVAAASRIFLRSGAERVNIHPLDREAAVFWGRRGFQPCGVGGIMCVRGKPAIAALIDGCTVRPDNGEMVLCGQPAHVERMRVPAGAR